MQAGLRTVQPAAPVPPVLREVRDVDGDVLNQPAEALTEAERIAHLKEVMGDPVPGADVFAGAIRAQCGVLYDRHVAPLMAAHWPEAVGAKDGKKLRFLARNLYASAPFTVLFCSQNPPAIIRFATSMGSTLGLSPSGLNKGASFALKLFSQVFNADDQRRIVQIAAFIATIDHAFDHYMDELSPKERERRIKGLLDGSWEPNHGSLKLTRALQVEMSRDISPEDQAVYDAALARVVEWVESEVAGMEGEADPHGLCHRLAGVEGTIDGLIFPVHRYAGEGARQWMYDVSLYVQMMDDWIDYEADRRDIRPTPVIEGKWTLGVIKDKWEDTLRGIEALARDAGMESESYQSFVREAYRYMMHDVMDAMVNGVAA